MSKEKYAQLSPQEKSKLNRFVLCLNKLSNHINKKPAAVTKPEETINIVSGYEFVITADLQDSFNQRVIKKSKLPFMGFHSPFKDNYVLLRSPQGLINQSEELEMLVKIVLKEGVQAGYVRILTDFITNWVLVIIVLFGSGLKEFQLMSAFGSWSCRLHCNMRSSPFKM